MHIINRKGKRECISFDLILDRIKLLSGNLESSNRFSKLNVNYDDIAKQVIASIVDNIKTTELDDIAASISENNKYIHYDYGILADRIAINNLEKNHANYLNMFLSDNEIYEKDILKNQPYYYTCLMLYNNIDDNGNKSPLIHPDMVRIVKYNPEIEQMFIYNNDYKLDYSGLKLMAKSYLKHTSFRKTRIVIERPQHMFMRVAIGIHAMAKYSNINKYNNFVLYEKYKETMYEKLPSSVFNKIYNNILNGSFDWMEFAKNNINLFPNIIDDVNNNIVNPNLDEPLILSNDVLANIKETYLALSNLNISHATPTLFNSGTVKQQFSSCYLQQISSDSSYGISDFWKDNFEIQKHAGGQGSNISMIRAKGSYIKGTNGHSTGLVPPIKVINEISKYVDQGGGNRPGSHALYIGLWHADINSVIELKKQKGNENERARSLFYGLWLPDEFMRCVKEENEYRKKNEVKKLWYLMCPNICPGLDDVYDAKLCESYINDPDPKDFAFTYLYRKYIAEGKYIANVSAMDLFKEIMEIIIENGIPYMCAKDNVNRKNNQMNLGVIKNSNLCTEIMEYSDQYETAVCNLASIVLTSILSETNNKHDFMPIMCYETSLKELYGIGNSISKKLYIDWCKLESLVRILVRNCNKMIDIGFYPTEKASYSNMKHRPIGIGVQDYANMLSILRLPFDSNEANKLNSALFEFIYYIALDESANLSNGQPYKSFAGSPASKGELQFDLWIKEQGGLLFPNVINWTNIKEKIKQKGLKNSLLIALMPTGSTSTIIGNKSPCFEPHTAIIYKRQNKVGESVIINKQFLTDMIEANLWNETLYNNILLTNDGSIKDLNLPDPIKNIYKISWDINHDDLAMSMLVRSPYIDQSQSFSWFIPKPNIGKMIKYYFNLWKMGAKTLSYYVRRLPETNAKKTQVKCTDEVCKSCEA